MQVNYVNIYINNHNTTRQVAAPKPTDFRLFLRNNVTSVRYIIYPYSICNVPLIGEKSL